MPQTLRRPLTAFAHTALLAVSIWIIGFALTANPVVFQLYRQPYRTSDGHRLSAALARGQFMDDDRLCLLIGASTVREGFDAGIMSDTVPELIFINGGTSGGTVSLFEPVVELIEHSLVRPCCVVIGLNARMLISRDVRLNSAGYSDFLDLRHRNLLDLEPAALRAEAHEQLLRNTIWPWNRTGRQLGRLIRVGIFHFQEDLSWRDPLSRRAFALEKRELTPAGQFVYPPGEKVSEEKLASLMEHYRAEGMFDPASYGRAEHRASLRRVIDRLQELADDVVIVRMPESSFGREHFAPHASDALEEILADAAASGVHVLDYQSTLPDSSFRDVGHILGTARPAFSRRVAADIAAALGLAPIEGGRRKDEG